MKWNKWDVHFEYFKGLHVCPFSNECPNCTYNLVLQIYLSFKVDFLNNYSIGRYILLYWHDDVWGQHVRIIHFALIAYIQVQQEESTWRILDRDLDGYILFSVLQLTPFHPIGRGPATCIQALRKCVQFRFVKTKLCRHLIYCSFDISLSKAFWRYIFYYLIFRTETFMMCVKVFCITRNKILVGSGKKWEISPYSPL